MKIDTDTQRVFIHPDGRMDLKATARYLGYSPKTLADWAMKGQGPQYVLLGGRAFYFLEDVQAWVAAAPRLAGTGGRDPRKPVSSPQCRAQIGQIFDVSALDAAAKSDKRV
tara:strand:- start:1736 stop:2068 length:333 start_codon:yes stop_codon:yes gene_type:complete